MELEHRFSVPVPVAQAWDVLLDVERIAPCMPGATVESFDGETIEGRVKVKVGPIQVTYAGTAKFVEKDEADRRAVIDANAKEARGSGTAAATITAVLTDAGGSTDVIVTTDLQITGKPAQFGRGVMVEVGNKILGKFADCLADELSGRPATTAVPPAAGGETAAAAAGISESTTASGAQATTPPPPLRRVQEEEAIDLLDTAGLPVLKRVLPVVGVVVLLLVVWRLVARRR
jgi:uncharacterized protein